MHSLKTANGVSFRCRLYEQINRWLFALAHSFLFCPLALRQLLLSRLEALEMLRDPANRISRIEAALYMA